MEQILFAYSRPSYIDPKVIGFYLDRVNINDSDVASDMVMQNIQWMQNQVSFAREKGQDKSDISYLESILETLRNENASYLPGLDNEQDDWFNRGECQYV